MTIDDKIRDNKLQHYINRDAAKILTLSSGKIDKYHQKFINSSCRWKDTTSRSKKSGRTS